MMKYKEYIAKVAFDDKAEIFHGEVANLKDVITFQGKSVKELKKAFKDSVDDYLAFCKERGEEPERPFSGKFPVRATPEEHQLFYLAAMRAHKSMNTWVRETLKKAASG
jgi:predicted HicB family RNase H-like nuclease